jgi:hypothetical protein
MRMNVCGYNSNYVAVQQKSMKENIIQLKSYAFALKVVLPTKKLEKQSIGFGF